MLFDDNQSLDSGVAANFSYQSGDVAGEIYWEQLTIGSFQIGYQAFSEHYSSLSSVDGADQYQSLQPQSRIRTWPMATSLASSDFHVSEISTFPCHPYADQAVPAASTIQTMIPGTTSSNPDGATFLDNLFGSGAYAPSNRLFSLALERREDVRTRSLLTIGETSDRLCPKPCSPNDLLVIPQSRLGSTGFVHWRIPLQGITATIWDDAADGEGAKNVSIPLGPSFVETSRSTPLAVLDSGGVQILVGRKAYADSIYSAFGVSASGDGLCESPLDVLHS